MPEIDALLINPMSARSVPAFLPHGLLYIASCAMQKGYAIRIYDRNVQGLDLERVLEESNPKVVGLGCLTGTSIDDAIYVSKKIKEKYPGIKVVWGGIHPSLYPDSVLSKEFVDFVVVGDGEAAFSGIIAAITGNDIPLGSIDNLGYKDGGQLRYNKLSFTDMESLPQPAWQLIDVEKYIRRKFYARRVITINTSRGCPYRCSFCCVPKVHRGKWRGISAEKILENLKFLKAHYGIDGFQVDDDEFDIDRNRVLSLCRLLAADKMDLKWSHFSRINIVNGDVLKEEIACGLRLIEFGVESGSSRMLEFLNKGQTPEQIVKAYSLCRQLGIKTSALFMVGLPTEDIRDLEETLRLIKRLKPHLTICTIFKPYPGTELFDFCIERGLFHYPERLEDIGAVYAKDPGISRIPDRTIRRIKRRFDLNNIYQEALNSVFTANFGLIVYYFKSGLSACLKGILKR